jgi:hypothetical protein
VYRGYPVKRDREKKDGVNELNTLPLSDREGVMRGEGSQEGEGEGVEGAGEGGRRKEGGGRRKEKEKRKEKKKKRKRKGSHVSFTTFLHSLLQISLHTVLHSFSIPACRPWSLNHIWD